MSALKSPNVKARPMLDTLRACCAALALSAVTAQAAPVTVYDNTSVDQLVSVMYSTGVYTELGDRVRLAAPSWLTRLDTQFFNAGTAAVFDATLNFYSAAGPTPTAIGGPFVVKDLAIDANSSLTVTFADLGALAVPDDLIVLFSVQLVSGGGDIGLNFFDTPAVGSSDNSFFMGNSGGGATVLQTLSGIDNIYLRIESSAPTMSVPEPAVLWLTLVPILGIAWRHRNYPDRRRSHA
jgi:hypothetical protein